MSRIEAIKRRHVAERTEDEGVLRTLAADESPIVRSGVARNEKTPSDVLTELAVDRSRPVVFAALANPSLPISVRYTYAKMTTDSEYAAAVENGAPEAHRAALHDIIASRIPEFTVANSKRAISQKKAAAELVLAKDSQTTPEQLSALAGSVSTPVKAAVARNPRTPECALYRLLSDSDRLVRNGVSINPSIPLAMRRRIVSTEPDVDIVARLIANSRKRDRVELAALARKSPHEAVRSFWNARKAKAEREAAAKEKEKARKKAEASKCPTPQKKRYTSKGRAAGSAGNASRTYDGKPFRVYPCKCGFWHMTTKKVRSTKKSS